MDGYLDEGIKSEHLGSTILFLKINEKPGIAFNKVGTYLMSNEK